MPTARTDVAIVNKYGLHARPAMQFVESANRFGSKISVSNGSLTVDAKSIMSVLRLAATQGTVLKITASGADAKEAVDTLAKIVADGFGEMEQGPPDASI